MGRLESSVTLFFATVAIAALKKFDVGPAMPAFFRLALTTVAVKSQLTNYPHIPLVPYCKLECFAISTVHAKRAVCSRLPARANLSMIKVDSKCSGFTRIKLI